MKTFRNILVFVLVLGLFALINLLVHELGHCFTIDSVGGKCEGVYVMPRTKVWPLAEFGQPYPDAWDNYIGLTVYAKAAPTEQASGFVSLMGSGSVAHCRCWLCLVCIFSVPRAGYDFPCWHSHSCSWTCFSTPSCRTGSGCAISSSSAGILPSLWTARSKWAYPNQHSLWAS